ncbi:MULTISPECIES: flagellar basal body L-ring protein FlgH [Shewanella]|uniref:flagellar basal body L-ring protein FlgH n=1 Tax=Shewanella TaxID=22 RepID=UPI000CA2C82D|nr:MULTISPECIES: flagellar basal body L-ring protein FlgH [Shewanella]EGT3628414.1 flagellar basal body L-ring protein FlgH [Morganella morganii]MBU1390561.1 flagellar basal body L-ring protein FlgH [Gammaproteobacteria bacterium]AUD61084.1 flagellar biosynthesis protein FlgH [Shewanella sp. Pdp11]MBU1476402.1 flagellar basal body L-ring protein FlgH [Gammaproteobacteria bacterium]MBU2003136.1 flagellar basal body L-ring protein FlgH [Gammaproteobacteria bacterium]
MARYLVVAVALLLAACSSTQKKPLADDPFYAPVYPEAPPTKIAATGSIYQDSQASSLYSDIRAHKVGDIITIVLKESTQAKKSAGNQIKKGSDMTLDPIFAGGSNVSIGGVPIDLRYKDSMNTKRESDADQSNSLDGSISANVMQVLNNGSLVIRGEKWISINNGDEFIRVTGLVRSQDIKPDNTIDSTRMANARIQYSGTGTFADAQKVGWLSQFFMSDWWPF